MRPDKGHQEAESDDTGGTDSGASVDACYEVEEPCSDLNDAPLILAGVDLPAGSSNQWDFFAASLAGGEDFNGDGLFDVAVSGPGGETVDGGPGAAYVVVVLGGTTGTVPWNQSDLVVTGIAGEASWTVAAFLPDQNNDGRAELLVGDDLASGVDSDTGDDGAIYLFVGGTAGTANFSQADGVIRGSSEFDGLTSNGALAGCVDVTGDGRPDVLAGACSAYSCAGAEPGAAFVFAGPVTTALSVHDAIAGWSGMEADWDMGSAVSCDGDVNADGSDDVLVGAAGAAAGAGSAYMFLGPVSGRGDASDADASFDGSSGYSQAGFKIAMVGDLNGDGYDDIAVATRDEIADDWPVHTFHGPPSEEGTMESAVAHIHGLEGGLSGVADVDDDGLNELLLGNALYADGAGASFLFLGPLTGNIGSEAADRVYLSGVKNDLVGYSVIDVGDVDGNGEEDIMIGALGSWTNETGGPGNAYVLPALPSD